MFRVTFDHQRAQSYVPILTGVTFGFIDRPLYFKVQAEHAPNAFDLSFVVSRNSEKKPLEFEITRGEGDHARFTFWNPSTSGASGLTNPIGFIQHPPHFVLGFVFMVDFLRGANMYRLTYEFSEGLVGPPEDVGGAE